MSVQQRKAEAVLFQKLEKLREKNPHEFMEFVRIARDRRHTPFSTMITRELIMDGWVDRDRREHLTTHDMYREIVSRYVIGDGLQTSIMISPSSTYHVHLPDDTIADKAMVDALVADFERLYERDPVAWAELVRMCRGTVTKPFGDTLELLDALGYVSVDGRVMIGLEEGGVRVQNDTVIAIQRYVQELLPHCATQGKGLALQPKKPYEHACHFIPASVLHGTMKMRQAMGAGKPPVHGKSEKHNHPSGHNGHPVGANGKTHH